MVISISRYAVQRGVQCRVVISADWWSVQCGDRCRGVIWTEWWPEQSGVQVLSFDSCTAEWWSVQNTVVEFSAQWCVCVVFSSKVLYTYRTTKANKSKQLCWVNIDSWSVKKNADFTNVSADGSAVMWKSLPRLCMEIADSWPQLITPLLKAKRIWECWGLETEEHKDCNS